MGNDLHWKQTPKPVEEEHHGLSMHTWHMLAEIFKKEDFEDLEGAEFSKADLKRLELIHDTAKACGDHEFASDIHGMMEGIWKFESITLVIKG